MFGGYFFNISSSLVRLFGLVRSISVMYSLLVYMLLLMLVVMLIFVIIILVLSSISRYLVFIFIVFGEYRIVEYTEYDDKFKDIDAYTAIATKNFFYKSCQILNQHILLSTAKTK